MGSVKHESVLAMFESRFDAWSAQAVLAETLDAAKVAADAAYSGADVVKLADTLEARRADDRVEEIVAYLKEAGEHSMAAAPAKQASTTPAKPAAQQPPKEDSGKKKGDTDSDAAKK